MFVESITAPEDEWHEWNERLRLHSDPPPALVLSIAWKAGEGTVTQLNVWDSPGAIADNYMERVFPIVQEHGEPDNKPERHGEPITVYVRPS